MSNDMELARGFPTPPCAALNPLKMYTPSQQNMRLLPYIYACDHTINE